MADYLVVHVINADVPSSSNASPNGYFVNLHYNGQNCTTSIKENVPRWDEKFCFHRRAQADHSDDLNLEAKVYNSRSLLGTILLSDVHFDRHSDNVVAISHPWEGTGPVLPHNSGGALVLKVFLAAADYVQLNIFNIMFAIEDRYVDQHPPIALRPADAVPKMISPNFEPGGVVERMQHLFVRVVKARKLPDMDANGGLDPYVEVTFGAYNKGVTKCLKRNKNPEWNETFAFPFQHGKTPSPIVDVVVNDKDRVRDDFVGKLCFDVGEIPERSPDDIPLEPTWYPLLDEGGETLTHGSLLVAIWIGSQADEAYPRAFVSLYSPKVYETPRLWCLRVTIFEARGITVADDEAGITRVFCKACVGDRIQKTRDGKRQMASSVRGYVWEEELVFVAAEPFFEGDLVVSVIVGPGRGNIIGTVTIPLASIDKRADDDHLVTPLWFDLKNPSVPLLDGSVDDYSAGNSSRMRICLRNLLEGGYHIGHDHPHYTGDRRPADRKLWNPPIGSVHLGILRAIGLTRSNISDGRSTQNPYCVAKYGDKWVRTRTIINGPDHVFNEQYAWDVYDLETLLNIGVFDHGTLEESGHRMIGKVRIRLSSLEIHRIYAHSYPLIILSPSGAMKIGELQLAVKITLESSYANMLRSYAQPLLPRMHYVQPLTDSMQKEYILRSQAANILALRLSRMEQPLMREVVACMCQTETAYSFWSFRKSKVNYFRLMGVVSPFIDLFRDVRSWENPALTLLAHAIFVLVLWFPKLVLLLMVLYGALLAMWNYRFRPDVPPFVDYDLSQIGNVQPDEFDEEFDTFPSTCSGELIRMRYDRFRHVSGWVINFVDEFASVGEKVQSLVNWRDPRATAIFYFFTSMIAVMAHFVPFKVLVAVAGFYIMRHPKLRTTIPSIFQNFFQRLPCKRDSFL